MKYSIVAVLCSLAVGSAFAPGVMKQQRNSALEMARKPFITGNWKLNPQTRGEAIALASGVANAVTPSSPGDVAIFVPYPFIETVQKTVGDKLIVGAEVS